MRGRGPLAVALALLGLALAAPSVGAHATLVRSDPPTGMTLVKAPSDLRLEFNEEVSRAEVRLLNGHGRVVQGTELSGGGRTLVLRLPQLPRDAYQVVWDVLSAEDGHLSNGALAFGVRTGVGPVGAHSSAGEPGSPLEFLLRWLDFLLMAGMLGGITIAAIVSSKLATARVGLRASHFAARRMLALAAASAGGALVLGLLLFAWEADDLRGALGPGESLIGSAGTLISERWGVLWILREGLLAALVITALLVTRRNIFRRIGRGALFTAGGLAVGAAIVRADGGHAASASGAVLAVGADAVHQVAAGVWIGGVFAFVVAVVATASVAGPAPNALLRAWWRPLAAVVAVSVVAVGITGLHAAGVQVTSVDGLLTTFYGGALIAKTALVVLLCLLGAINTWIVHRGRHNREASRPLGLLLVEALIGVMVLGAAAAMTSSAPPRGPEFAPPQAAPIPTLSAANGDLVTLASVRPNRPGTNIVTVMAASSRRPPPAPIDSIAMRIERIGSPPDDVRSVRLSQFAANQFSGGVNLPREGGWRMRIVLSRAGERLANGFEWRVAPPDPARPVSVSAQPLAPLVDRIAVGLLFLLVAAAVCVISLRRLRPRNPSEVEAAIGAGNRAAAR